MTHIRRYIIALLFLFADHAFGQESTSKPESIAYNNPVITKAHTAQPIPKRLRVVMMTDFPPIGVVKAGNVPNDQKVTLMICSRSFVFFCMQTSLISKALSYHPVPLQIRPRK
jgi:hypothetical protein